MSIAGECLHSPFRCIMSFIERFFPDEYLDSAYDVDYEKLYKEGKRGIIFDIDNTLVEHGAPANDRSRGLFSRLFDIGFKCLVLSNNKKPRVESFAKGISDKLLYIHKADKPLKKGYLRALEMLGTGIEETVYVGDQIFTDVWGAKRMGIYSILTRPIDPREEIQIVLKRRLEAPVLRKFMEERS